MFTTGVQGFDPSPYDLLDGFNTQYAQYTTETQPTDPQYPETRSIDG